VSTSLSESFGLANLEAMTAGTAHMQRRGRVPRWWARRGAGAPDLEPLAAAMQRLLDDDGLRNKPRGAQ
jgi:hypothetical protein